MSKKNFKKDTKRFTLMNKIEIIECIKKFSDIRIVKKNVKI